MYARSLIKLEDITSEEIVIRYDDEKNVTLSKNVCVLTLDDVHVNMMELEHD